MQPFRANALRLIALFVAFVILIATQDFPQSNRAEEQTTFRSNVRVVLIDVVVTDSKDEPVSGLPMEQFQVFEDGKLQGLASFEERSGLPDMPALTRMAKLPPNVFSNAPLVKAGDAANILLLDSLNTEMADQSYVHSQMIKYIREIRPGTRLAIFTLGSRLRFVQGFTGDPALLMAAVDGKNTAANPAPSPLLQTGAEKDANQRVIDQMQETQDATGANLQGAIDALRQFQAENTVSQLDVRMKTTLQAMQQLGMYLEGIPGRKNVIWFAGSFPVSNLPLADLPDPGAVLRQYDDDVVKTANILAAAQVAIYPVSPKGVAVDRHYDFTNQQPPKSATAKRMTEYQNQDLQGGSLERTATYAAMDELAKNTGGEANYGTNSLNEALDHVMKIGTHYYTLSYSPTNRNMDGQFRKIEVRVSGGKYHLAYRRGYYATETFLASAVKRKPSGDPLRPLMDHGTPASTEILYTVHVVVAATQTGDQQPGQGSLRAGDNQNLKGPVTRYTITFAVSPEHLALESSADGVRHGNMEVTAIVYDRDGTPVNWMVRLLQVAVPPERYAQVLAAGVAFNLEIDATANGAYLRSGLYDLGSNKAGSLEIPLAAVVAQAVAPN